eukprot:5174108-Prymnesium_polylepis.1
MTSVALNTEQQSPIWQPQRSEFVADEPTRLFQRLAFHDVHRPCRRLPRVRPLRTPHARGVPLNFLDVAQVLASCYHHASMENYPAGAHVRRRHRQPTRYPTGTRRPGA